MKQAETTFTVAYRGKGGHEALARELDGAFDDLRLICEDGSETSAERPLA